MDAESAVMRSHGAQQRAQSQLLVRVRGDDHRPQRGTATCASFCAAAPLLPSTGGCRIPEVPVTSLRSPFSGALNDDFVKQMAFCLKGNGITSTSCGDIQHRSAGCCRLQLLSVAEHSPPSTGLCCLVYFW